MVQLGVDSCRGLGTVAQQLSDLGQWSAARE